MVIFNERDVGINFFQMETYVEGYFLASTENSRRADWKCSTRAYY